MNKVSTSITLLALLCQILPVESAPSQHAFNFTEAYKLAIKLNQDADNDLFENMEMIAEWFAMHKEQHGHFPEIGADQEKADQFFKRVLKRNPFSATSVKSKQEAERHCIVRYECGSQLNTKLIQQWETSPPSLWKAEPGTITVMTNSENLLLIWAAGADHLPLVDPRNRKTRFLVREVPFQPASTDSITDE